MTTFVLDHDQQGLLAWESRRGLRRREIRTIGAAVACSQGAPGAPDYIPVWTGNLSLEGAELHAHDEIPGDWIYLNLLHPDFRNSYFFGEIVRRRTCMELPRDAAGRPAYVYGVRFDQLLNGQMLPGEVAETFEDCRTMIDSDPDSVSEDVAEAPPANGNTSDPARPSQIPFLSAIGLTVVYNYLSFGIGG